MTASEALMRAGGRRRSVRARLGHPGALRWYAGASTGLLYQSVELVGIWTSEGSLLARTIATVSLGALYVVYFFLPPLLWQSSERVRVGSTLAVTVLSLLLFFTVGPTTVWAWLLLVVMAAFTWSSQPMAIAYVLVLAGAATSIAALLGWPDSISAAPWILLSVGVLMVAFGGQVRQTVQLRAANEEIARLAVDEERLRFARDLHDSLGHSLTVVAVKSELAGKLLTRDPAAAAAEIASIEGLAREALSDLRASVSGFRGITLEGELAAARTALVAAGVEAVLPHLAPAVKPALQQVFAWAVREGVTNVLRHADARTCTVTVTRTAVRIRNDGSARSSASSAGSGLKGLAERAAAAGARLDARPLAAGGFELRVER